MFDCKAGVMRPTMPKSKKARCPVSITSRFPGCGSAWKKPSSRSCFREARTSRRLTLSGEKWRRVGARQQAVALDGRDAPRPQTVEVGHLRAADELHRDDARRGVRP